MTKINNKGFTLVEVIAVVVIISVLTMLLAPNIIDLLNRGKENSYDDLEKSFVSAAEQYVTDNRYNISVSGSNVTRIGNYAITGNKITIEILLVNGYLEEDSGGYKNPMNSSEKLNLSNSYVTVTYNSTKKDFEFKIGYLDWE